MSFTPHPPTKKSDVVPSQPTPASAEWRQLCDRIGLLGHSRSRLELKVHWTSSRKIGPLPLPKLALLYALPAVIHRAICLKYQNNLKTVKHRLTSSVCISQLLADYSSISVVPGVITHSPPLVIDAHFHSPLILVGAIHQTNITICTVACCNYYLENIANIAVWNGC